MIEYLILFIIVFFSIIVYDIGKNKETKKFIYFLLFIYSTLLMGLRYKVGIDTYNYIDFYKSVPYFEFIDFTLISEFRVPPLFLIISSLIKTYISNEFYVFQLFHAFFINLVIFSFIYKNIKEIFIGLFVYFLLYYLYFNTEILKESIAVSVFLLNYKNLTNKKWFKYYCLVLVSVLFHYSALILLLLPFVNSLRLNKKFIAFFVISTLIFVNLSFFLKHLIFLPEIEKIQLYLEQEEIKNMNITWNILLTIQLSLFPLFTLFFLKKTYGIILKFEGLLLLMVIIGSGCMLNGVIFQRLTNYFIPFYGISLAYLIYFYFVRTNKNKFLVTIFLASLFMLYTYDFWSNSKYNIWIPYHSIFNEVEDPGRKSLYNRLFKQY